MSAGEEWFRRWFGEAYLALYPHRDLAEAEAAVRLFAEVADPAAGARVLDLACGAGRHLDPLVRRDLRPVGVDLSAALLAEARRGGTGRRLVRADMRSLPFEASSFDAAVNFFTSFGYFAHPGEDERVLAELRRVLRDGGAFLIDYLNASHVRRTLVPEDEREVDGRRVLQRRRVEGNTVVKRIEIEDPGGGPPEVHHERVRLYEPADLERLLARHGLRVDRRFGDYAGGEHGPEAGRLVLVGRAT